jgi:hypothetical protein
MPPLADLLPHTISPYITLMIVGFFVGTFGHMSRTRWLVGVGIAMIFLATLLLPLAVIATEDEPPGPSSPDIYAPGTK